MIPIEHGKICARLIPDADTLWVEGMGHDVPEIFMDEILESVFEVFKEAEEIESTLPPSAFL